MREGTLAFIRKGDTFLFVLRDDIKGIVFPNRWSVVGGGLENKESAEECVLREVKEETGIIPFSCEYLCSSELSTMVQSETRVVLEHAFFLITNMDVVVLTEGQCFAWLSLEEILKRDIPSHIRSLIEEFREKLTE